MRLCLVRDLRLHERGADVARADGAGGDPASAPLDGERLHEPDHAVLRGDVARLERRGHQAVHRRDHAEAAVARPASASHAYFASRNGLRQEQRDQLGPSWSSGTRTGATCWKPAFATSASSRPKRCERRHPRPARLPSRVARSASPTRATCTAKPSASSRATIALPIPPLAPVTRATRSHVERKTTRPRRPACRRPRARPSRSSRPARRRRTRRPTALDEARSATDGTGAGKRTRSRP